MLRIDINNFCQCDGETFYESWERFKDLLRKCPHHSFTKGMQVNHLYDGLRIPTRTLIDLQLDERLWERMKWRHTKFLRT